ncbi:tyrosine-protein kinase JAK3 [Bufo gargarizans]|uniref:tyrosine-protein kinase JAK3 n=1 Tax=Bufo gargarizans TaxID=30331 RepID=UPI001CF24F12|nr:tyrosine-protein kinase JAK3 [Bufo gargarizans]XP_044141260.1 tyrosine-protein kinase JAK3 [Bufo gargarizans]
MSGEYAPLLSGSRSCSSYSSATGSLTLLLYTSSLPSTSQSDPQMVFSGGQYSAEELCIAAAKSCEILPVYHSLFALASPDLKTWYNPNHIFTVDEGIAHVVVYRIRFFFPGWIGISEHRSARCSLMSLVPEPILSYQVIDYLFAQYRRDFIDGRIQLPINIDVQEQCLALAVLDMMRLAQENDKTPKEILSSISYKHCVPQSLRQSIVNLNFFCRKRLRRNVQKSLKKMRACVLSVPLIKIKYLVDLEKLDPDFGIETFFVRSTHKDSKDLVLRVSRCDGIIWKEVDSELWQPFSDFEDIVDIRITQADSDQKSGGRIVTITKQNNKVLEAQFQMLRDTLSFVSLVDGYYRLTKDSQHYFCEEVAPPRLRWNLDNQCHGPITSEFAIDKLKNNGSVGSYVLRYSPQEYDKLLLTVCLETPLGKDFQGCSIQCKNDTFSLVGVSRYFSSLRNLLEYYKHNKLCLGGVSTCLTYCCPPRAKEKSNLLILHNNYSPQMMSPTRQRRQIPLLTFQKIHLNDITFLESQGKGSFTKIFHGLRRDADGEEEHKVDVLLKILDATHQHYQESFLEAASLMNQLSHKHQVLLHGVCVGKQIVMVQEYETLGAVDLYLKRRQQKGPIPISWKLEVVKQLAYALCYMEDKQLVHGNISAKKILLSREGDKDTPPFIKLSDRGVSIKILERGMLLERIPWLAPECVSDVRTLALESDCWSFGVTMWEIFNDGIVPLNTEEPEKKLQFYKDQRQLPAPHWIELASLEQQCMSYNPALRLPFRSIIRELNNIIASDYELLVDSKGQQMKDGFRVCDRVWEYQDPSVYEERHLKYVSVIGKGNFGSVELCRYDPLGDNTGELVAVKKLQHSTAEHVQDFHRESLILRALHSDYIVKYKGICYSAGRRSFQLVMEYLPNGSLQEFIPKNRDGLRFHHLLLYASQICKGMLYLGSQRYLHRDLASRNILVESPNHVKIGDFGLTKILPQDKEYYVVREQGQSPIFWHAPESLSDNIYSRESDVWSFGVLLYELFTYCERSCSPSAEYRRMMGSHNSQQTVCGLVELLRAEKRLFSPACCPVKVYKMMLSCWSFQPSERPTFSALENQCEQLRREYQSVPNTRNGNMYEAEFQFS